MFYPGCAQQTIVKMIITNDPITHYHKLAHNDIG